VGTEMGSVAVGALVVGTSMLVVFAVAMATLDSQVESGLSELESAAEPLPSFTIDDATNIGTSGATASGAVVDYTIHDGGSGYTGGDAVEVVSPGTGVKFTATLEVDSSGTVTGLDITDYGRSYLYASSPFEINVTSSGSPGDGTLNITTVLGNIVHVNITNDGTIDLDTDRTWLFTDGLDTRNLSDQLQGNLPDTIFPGDTLHYYYYTGSEDTVDRIAVTTNGVTKVARVL